MTRDQMLAHLRAANETALEAAAHGHHPFGAVLVGPDDRVLMRQGNIGTVRHAETELARRAAEAYEPEFLWSCSMVLDRRALRHVHGHALLGEYGRLVYGYEEAALLALTADHPANPTINLPSRTVLAAGQKDVKVVGPFPEFEAELLAPHRTFWKR